MQIKLRFGLYVGNIVSPREMRLCAVPPAIVAVIVGGKVLR